MTATTQFLLIGRFEVWTPDGIGKYGTASRMAYTTFDPPEGRSDIVKSLLFSLAHDEAFIASIVEMIPRD